MSKHLSRTFLDKDRQMWKDGIRAAKARIVVLNRAIRIFKNNLREGVPAPKTEGQEQH